MHKEKTTTDLLSDIRSSSGIDDFLNRNEAELHAPTIAQHLKQMIAERNLSIGALAEQMGYSRDYLYKLLDNTRNMPTRNCLLCMAFTMKLSYAETVLLLKYAPVNPLYARSPADSIIIYSLQHGLSLAETNEQLARHHLPLLGNKRAN